MECKKCKNTILPKWNYCDQCGTRLKSKKECAKFLKEAKAKMVNENDCSSRKGKRK